LGKDERGMDFELTDEQRAFKKTAQEFAKKEISPLVNEDEKSHRFQRELLLKMGSLGFFGCPLPEEYGGSNSGFLSHALVTEEVAKVSGSLRAAFNMQTMGTAREILQYGSVEQKRKYIPKLISAEWLGCIGITEPNAGSDVAAMQSVAGKEGDHYLLNGTKTWITYAPVADVGVIYAYTDRSKKHKGISAFIVELKSRGITTRSIEEKMGWYACPTGEIVFVDVMIPEANLIGKEGDGFTYLMGSLNNTRLTAAAGAVGVCQGLIDETIRYAQEREQFGEAIGKFQMIQEQIACMIVETEAARLLTYRCAWQKDRGDANTLETSMAKLYSCDVASRISDMALQILGSYGYSGEYPVERYLRDAKLYPILEGSANIHKMIIALDALGYRKANR
jgi:glutaryl-CoA dehydrogenase (non-decarboxylating)